jgi:hypothetical protein
MDDVSAPRAHRRTWVTGGLVVHLAVVVVFSVVFVALSWRPTVDANIGGGVASLPLLVLGLPWSVLSYLSNTDHGWQLSLVGAALLNVVIHGGVLSMRRPGPQAPGAAGGRSV